MKRQNSAASVFRVAKFARGSKPGTRQPFGGGGRRAKSGGVSKWNERRRLQLPRRRRILTGLLWIGTGLGNANLRAVFRYTPDPCSMQDHVPVELR